MTGALLALLLAQAIGNTSPPGVVVQDEGVDQGRARKLNCVGAGIACSVSAGVGTMTVAGGGAGTTVTQVAVNLGTQAVPNFTATITDAAVTATSKIVAVQDGAAVPIPVGTIAFVDAATQGILSTSQVVLSYTTTAGNALVVGIGLFSTTARVVSVTDTGGSTFVYRGRIAGTGIATELWTAQNIKASTSITVNVSAVITQVDVTGAQYSGVFTPEAVASASGNSAAPSISLAIQSGNNWIVAMSEVDVPGTASAGTGNFRVGNDPILVDNTATSAGSVTASFNYSGATNFTTVAVELDGGAKAADENELDPFTCNASPGAGSFSLNCTAVGTLLTGRYRINYLFQ